MEYQIQACRDIPNPEDETEVFVERCTSEEAEYWGVYSGAPGGWEWLADYATEAEAIVAIASLRAGRGPTEGWLDIRRID